MGNKFKDFLFKSKENNELDTTTIVISKDTLKEEKKMNTTTPTNSLNNSQTKIITPQVFSEVEAIANDILNGDSVIVDLTNTDLAEAKRICDFLNGVTFAIGGSVEKIVKLVYLFHPKTHK